MNPVFRRVRQAQATTELVSDGIYIWISTQGDIAAWPDHEMDAMQFSELIRAHVDSDINSLSIPESMISDNILQRFGAHSVDRWSFFDRVVQSEESITSSAGMELLQPEDPRINKLLAYSDSAYIFAGDSRVHAWYGISDFATGDLVCVGHERRDVPGMLHVGSICTAPSARGAGLAGRFLRHVLGEAQRESKDAVFLGMYADNAAGRRLYLREGFQETGPIVSLHRRKL